jgi:hypothetical protein
LAFLCVRVCSFKSGYCSFSFAGDRPPFASTSANLKVTDAELAPFNGVIDACQTLLDHLLALHHDEKLTEASLSNLAREAQCLLRRALVAAQEPAAFNAAAHAGHAAKAAALAVRGSHNSSRPTAACIGRALFFCWVASFSSR